MKGGLFDGTARRKHTGRTRPKSNIPGSGTTCFMFWPDKDETEWNNSSARVLWWFGECSKFPVPRIVQFLETVAGNDTCHHIHAAVLLPFAFCPPPMHSPSRTLLRNRSSLSPTAELSHGRLRRTKMREPVESASWSYENRERNVRRLHYGLAIKLGAPTPWGCEVAFRPKSTPFFYSDAPGSI